MRALSLLRCLVPALCAAALPAQVSVLTWQNDAGRTGQNLQETILTPANVRSATFGKLFQIPADGKVDAQPLSVPALAIPGNGTHNVLFVATEHDTAYAFDADTGGMLWSTSLLGANETPSDARGCDQVVPEIGVTATPVIDPQIGPHGTIYLVAMSKDSSGAYHQRLHALDLTTGGEQFGGPVEVQATYPGRGAEGASGVQTFSPGQHEDRAALLIANGVVYTSWSSHCDASPYTSWVIGYDESTLARAGVINLVPNGSMGGIWGAGSGPSADDAGNLYVLTGNGTFDTTLDSSGFPSKSDYGNALVKVSPGAGAPAVTDYFTMSNTVAESNADTDFGSGGAMLLPPLADAQGNTRSLAVAAGKDTNIYVMDRDNMGKFNSKSNAIYQQLSQVLGGGVWSSPAWFNGSLYYAPVGGKLRAFQFANGAFGSAPVSQSPTSFPFPGATPSISANGTSNGIVWVTENRTPAVLHAYDASNLATELYNSNQAAGQRDTFGAGNKFIVPTVVNGKVYVGTTAGVGVFGLLNKTPAALAVTKTHTGTFIQGQTGATYTVTVANQAGAGATSGTVTLAESIPAGLTLVAMSGIGWTCATTCTRADTLAGGASYPTVTVQVNVATDAPSQVTNQVTVSGGGSATAMASDATTVAPLSSGPPAPVSAIPAAGSGNASFVFTFSDPRGWQDLSVVNVLINNVLDGRAACYLAYTVTAHTLYLVNDAGNAIMESGSSGASNSQCAVNPSGTGAVGSGNTLTLTVNLSFTSGFAGGRVIYMAARDASGGNSGWQALGTWQVAGLTASGPQVGGVTPARAATLGQSFTFTFTDSGGWQDLTVVNVLIAGAIDGRGACYLAFVPASNALLLVDDAGDAGGPYQGMVLPASGAIANSQCSVNLNASSFITSGNTLTLTLALTFNPGFAGNQIVYLAARGQTQNSGWQPSGSIAVP